MCLAAATEARMPYGGAPTVRRPHPATGGEAPTCCSQKKPTEQQDPAGPKTNKHNYFKKKESTLIDARGWGWGEWGEGASPVAQMVKSLPALMGEPASRPWAWVVFNGDGVSV